MKRRRGLWLVTGLLLAFGADYAAYPSLARPSGRVVDRGENGIWLRYDWYFGEQKDYEGLARRLKDHGFRDAYFHVRSIGPDGSLKFRKRNALNREMRRLAPNVRRFAWIYAGNPQGLGKVDLAKAAVRKRMVAEAVWLVKAAGFDGVQWDYEICPDRDPNLLKLLEETRKALPKGAPISVAVPGWYPPPLEGFGWTKPYYREVAARSDGMAVMAYDSAMLTPRAYVGWITQQTVRATQAAAGTGCRVILGVPTYEDGTASHNPWAENLSLALLGVRNGLANGADLSAWQGVGLFADYTTDAAEWRTFDELWRGVRTPSENGSLE